LRPQTKAWWELFALLVREGDLRGQRILEVGCGTGTLAAALAERELAKVWAIDREPAMVAQARARLPRGAQARVAEAEALPFKDGWFDRAVMRLVVHHLERPRAFAELHRVLTEQGRLVVATIDHAGVAGTWFNEFFPSARMHDIDRFAPAETLIAELTGAGFVDVTSTVLEQEERWPRDEALRKLRARFVSSLEVVPDYELEQGLARAQVELPDVLVRPLCWRILVATA
jgi:ubiquinone/menaquinone biosynthesis C-methylase UbiE